MEKVSVRCWCSMMGCCWGYIAPQHAPNAPGLRAGERFTRLGAVSGEPLFSAAGRRVNSASAIGVIRILQAATCVILERHAVAPRPQDPVVCFLGQRRVDWLDCRCRGCRSHDGLGADARAARRDCCEHKSGACLSPDWSAIRHARSRDERLDALAAARRALSRLSSSARCTVNASCGRAPRTPRAPGAVRPGPHPTAPALAGPPPHPPPPVTKVVVSGHSRLPARKDVDEERALWIRSQAAAGPASRASRR